MQRFMSLHVRSQGLIVLAAIFFTLIFSVPVLAVANMSGVVKDASGQPVIGALVKVMGTETGLSYMVVSQASGRYSTPALLPGYYTIQAIGGSYQSDVAGPVEVGNDQQVEAVLVLGTVRVIPPPAVIMTNTDYAKLMPEEESRNLIISTCTRCHSLDRVVPARKTEQAWQKTVDRMSYFLEDRTDLGGPLSSQQKQLVVDYLARHFNPDTPDLPEAGPTDPNRHLPQVLLGAEARFVAMEFDPDTHAENKENELGIDAQGNAWISEGGTPWFGRFDPVSLIYTRIEAPPAKSPRSLAQIAIDPQGQVWIMDNSTAPDSGLLHYDPRSKAYKSYAIQAPPRYRAPLNTLRFLDGNVWGTGNASSRIVKVEPDTGEVTAYAAPRGSHPYGLAIGADKAVWYTANYKDEIIRLDPETGEQKVYQALTRQSGLRRMGADAVGNIWAAAQDSNKLVKVDSRTGEVSEYTVPTKNAGPYSVDIDNTRNLVWFSERDADRIGRFDPDTGGFVEFPLPYADSDARRIFVDPVNPNRVWWGCACARGSIGYIEIME